MFSAFRLWCAVGPECIFILFLMLLNKTRVQFLLESPNFLHKNPIAILQLTYCAPIKVCPHTHTTVLLVVHRTDCLFSIQIELHFGEPLSLGYRMCRAFRDQGSTVDCIVMARGSSNRPLLRRQAGRNPTMNGLNETFGEACCKAWRFVWNRDTFVHRT